MHPRDTVLAVLTTTVWGLAFVASGIALKSFSPLQLVGLRFSIAALPALFVRRPRVPWRDIAWVGATLFGGQFLLLFLGMAMGLSPGLASVSQQTQACFTVLLAALLLGEVPTAQQGTGMALAFGGIALIGATAGADLRPLGLALGLAGALSWATGNILIKRMPRVPMLSLVVWASLIPPLPAFLLSYVLDTQTPLHLAWTYATPWSVAGALYLGVFGTLGGYGLWAYLLQRYPAATIAPFSLLSPCVGVVASFLLLGERFSPARLGGMALVVGGLAVIVAPVRRLRRNAAAAIGE